MGKSSKILLALCAGLPVMAQAPDALTISSGASSLTLYGILDAGVAKVDHSLNFDAYHPVAVNPTLTKAGNTSATGIFNGGISQTRVGLKGALDLGNSLKGVFTLESAINIPNGNVSNATESLAMTRSTGPSMAADSAIAGQVFSRNANFGLSSDTFGTLTVGRHTSFMLDYIPAYDALQGAQMFTPIGFSGLYGGGGATDSSRLDSCLKYRVKVGDVTLGGLYKFGGVSGSSGARGATEFVVAYERGGFGLMAAYQSIKDATAVGDPSGTINGSLLTAIPTPTPANGTVVYEPIGTITVTCEDTKGTMVALHYKVGDWLFTTGYQYLQYTNPSDPSTDAQLTSLYGSPIGTWIQGGAIVPAVNVTHFTVGGSPMEKDLTVGWLGVRYEFTSKLSLAASYYHVGQNDFSNGTATAADKSGTTKYSSVLLDYTFSKAFDAYIGYMGVKGSGGMVAGYTYDDNSSLGVGLRYKF